MGTIIPQDVNLPLKKCSKCPNYYPATSEYFHRDKKGKDGLAAHCKKCAKEYKDNNKEKISQYRKVYGKKYYELNKDKSRELSKQYRQDHKEEIKKYRKKNKEKLSKQERKYKENHKETIRQQLKEYRQKHKAIYQEYNKQYHQEHREERLEYHKSYSKTEHGRNIRRAIKHRRRALKKSIGGNYTIVQLQDQLKRQKNKCYYCHTRLDDSNWHADHIVPITRDGSNNTIDNIVITCPTCNLRKHNKLPHEWPEGGRLL